MRREFCLGSGSGSQEKEFGLYAANLTVEMLTNCK